MIVHVGVCTMRNYSLHVYQQTIYQEEALVYVYSRLVNVCVYTKQEAYGIYYSLLCVTNNYPKKKPWCKYKLLKQETCVFNIITICL